MDKIRVVIVGVTRLLGDLLEDEMSDQADMEVVARLAAEQDLALQVRNTQADVVLCSLGAAALREVFGTLLRAHPDVAVVSLPDEGRSLLKCELSPSVAACGEASMPRLLELIRSARATGAP